MIFLMDKRYVVRCDESPESPLLLAHLKDYDRIVSRESAGKFKNMNELIKKEECVIDETVTELAKKTHYIRCTIKSEADVISMEGTVFYQCNFIGVKEIDGAIMYGENLSIGGPIHLKKINLPIGNFRIKEISLGDLNKKLQSPEIISELIGAFLRDEFTGMYNLLHALAASRSKPLALELLSNSLPRISRRIEALRDKVGMNISIGIIDLAMEICGEILFDS